MRIFLIISLLMSVVISARQPYHADIFVAGEEGSVSASNLLDLTKDLRQEALELLIPFYTPVSPLEIAIDLRGIDVISSFAAGSTALVVSIPEAEITETFTGATRDDSLKLFKDYIKEGGDNHRLLRAYAKYSPIDPIAGNPNSLMAQMAQSDYLIGHLSPFAGCDCSFSSQPIVHQFQLGSNFARGFSKGFDTTSVTLPLRYSYSPDLSWAFILDAPFTYVRNGGASSIFSSLGFGLRLPITYNWSLTPTLRGGFGGSLDLCTSASFLSTGLTSVYNYKVSDYVISVTNCLDYIFSTNLWLTGVNFNYHLHNWVFKNGVQINSCEGFCFLKRPYNFSFAFIDSSFVGSSLFIEHYDEINFSLITTHINPCLDYDCLTVGVSYLFGEKNYHGYSLNLSYQF